MFGEYAYHNRVPLLKQVDLLGPHDQRDVPAFHHQTKHRHERETWRHGWVSSDLHRLNAGQQNLVHAPALPQAAPQGPAHAVPGGAAATPPLPTTEGTGIDLTGANDSIGPNQQSQQVAGTQNGRQPTEAGTAADLVTIPDGDEQGETDTNHEIGEGDAMEDVKEEGAEGVQRAVVPLTTSVNRVISSGGET